MYGDKYFLRRNEVIRSLVRLETSGLFVLADFFESLGFDLADTFSGDAKFFSNLFECMVRAVEQPVSHLEDLSFFVRQRVENLGDLVG